MRDGTLGRSIGTALFQGYSVLLKAVEIERKAAETDELLRRLEALEAHEQSRSGRYR